MVNRPSALSLTNAVRANMRALVNEVGPGIPVVPWPLTAARYSNNLYSVSLVSRPQKSPLTEFPPGQGLLSQHNSYIVSSEDSLPSLRSTYQSKISKTSASAGRSKSSVLFHTKRFLSLWLASRWSFGLVSLHRSVRLWEPNAKCIPSKFQLAIEVSRTAVTRVVHYE